MEDLTNSDACVLGGGQCRVATACPLHEFWKSVRTRYEEQLHTKTLAEFAKFERPIVRKTRRETVK